MCERVSETDTGAGRNGGGINAVRCEVDDVWKGR